ncbi:type VI secretion system tube protein Hcp [Methylomarinum sp. Ch1-1]|uniref:Type VI secretion system tube protein Hcp n=1 Tax=Methylomarinum roseum TaxID=3067653 RepID=A0AAU7NSG3_9GAMM|nr:type VI secretion system tube protein Hcp [Methylomarinum sp. Ch1-1]MDP4520088.1 type VI secretion system tube protein Hcp [Methylomarinum sp. Ch1-1]
MILLNFETAIKGDSTVADHADWITIDSFQFGVGRAITASGGGQDRETSNPSFSEVTLTKSMDKASTELMMQATCGKSLGKATIHFIQTGGADAKGQEYLEYVLHDAIISSYSVSSGGERPSESISINFNGFQTKYNAFTEGGTVSKGEQKGWDLMKNEAI